MQTHASEVWTEEPQSDGEDAATACAAREASDEEEADDSEPVVPMTLREARESGQALKIFFKRPYLQAMQTMVREMEAMTVSSVSPAGRRRARRSRRPPDNDASR